jgi:HD-GYP domain-containing protein (c-di-GMP phosphodiesterase class II)
MVSDQTEKTTVRLAELMAALSIATDLGMGQPVEYALQSCNLAVRLGEKLGLAEEDLRDVYYQALLRFIGCNVETDMMATLLGDEMAIRRELAPVDATDLPGTLRIITRAIWQSHQGHSTLELVYAMMAGLLKSRTITQQMFAGHCEVAQRLAERIGFSGKVLVALGQLYERWDGKGLPWGLKGEAIETAVLVVTLAQDMVLFYRLGGLEAATAVAQQRRTSQYAPFVADCFCQHAPLLLAGMDSDPTWDNVIALEPGAHQVLSAAQLDKACQAMADFVDIKTPFTMGHSSRVAELAAAAAQRVGLPEGDVTAVRRAGWLHDIGKTGVSAGIWMKAEMLTEKEWEQIRLHPYYTERILQRPSALAHIGQIAALHHERLDGSGYYRGLTADTLTPAARILAAANAYQTKREERPHRPVLTPEAAAAALQQEVRAGRLDSEAVHHVLAAAGHATTPLPRELVAGLSQRQMEVLRLLARGLTIKQIGAELVIAPKTADNHIQHIYNKIGVTTRAGATLFAMENNLL